NLRMNLALRMRQAASTRLETPLATPLLRARGGERSDRLFETPLDRTGARSPRRRPRLRRGRGEPDQAPKPDRIPSPGLLQLSKRWRTLLESATMVGRARLTSRFRISLTGTPPFECGPAGEAAPVLPSDPR